MVAVAVGEEDLFQLYTLFGYLLQYIIAAVGSIYKSTVHVLVPDKVRVYPELAKRGKIEHVHIITAFPRYIISISLRYVPR